MALNAIRFHAHALKTYNLITEEFSRIGLKPYWFVSESVCAATMNVTNISTLPGSKDDFRFSSYNYIE